MKTNIHPKRSLLFVCVFLFFAKPGMQAADPARLAELRGVWQAHFNHDASRLVVRTREGEVGLWDAKKGTRIAGDATLKKPSNTYIMSPDARKFLVGFKDSRARVFDASTGSAVSPVLDLAVREAASPQALFSPDGNTLVFFGAKDTSVLEVKTGKRIATIPIQFELEEDSETTAAGAFASEGATCFLMDSQGMVTAYQTKDWTPLGQPMKHPAAESAYQFGFEPSKDGKWIVTFDGPGENGPEGNLQAWDAFTNKPLGEPLSAVNGMDGQFLPGQNRVLVRSGRGEATVRDLPSMSIAYAIKQHDDVDGPQVVVFPNGKWLLAWGPDKNVDLIDAASGNILKTDSSPASVRGSMIAPDSSLCYLEIDNSVFLGETHWDYYVQRFSIPDLKATGSIRVANFLARRSLSSDGRWIIIIQGESDHEQIVVFDAATLKPVEWSRPK